MATGSVGKMIVYLIISSYRSLGIGRHYYGRLRCSGERVDVTRKLSSTEAAIVRQQSGREWPLTDDISVSFHLKSDLIFKAKQIWRDEFPEGVLLVEGSGPACSEPQRALDGSPELVAEVNEMHRRCEKLGWWDGNHVDEVARICHRWNQIKEEVKCIPETK